MAGISIIREMLGVTNPADPGLAMLQAHNTLTGEALNAEEFAAERARLDTLAAHEGEEAPLHDVERLVTYEALKELLETKEIRTSTTVSSWLTYHEMLERDGHPANGKGVALMIGSICALSSRSFVTFAHREYRVDRAIVIDPQTGRDKPRHGQFILGSGLRLPLRGESVDFVHTNSLLPFLADPDVRPGDPEPTYRQMARQLFKEISRVLKPGGQLLMQEVMRGLDEHAEQEVMDTMVRREANFIGLILERVGLRRPFIGAPPWPINRDFLFQRHPSFDKLLVAPTPGTLSIYAQKPVRREPVGQQRGRTVARRSK